MSLIFFPESEALVSDSNERECELSRSARSNHSRAPFSPSIGQAFPAMAILPPANLSKAKPISSAEDSPVRISVSPAKAPDLPAPVLDSTGCWFEPFAWYDRASRSWKTWQHCLLGDWEPFSETWPRSGMTRNGIA